MRLFENRATMGDVLGNTRKWSRTLEAVEAAPGLPPGVMYSLGDSVTYLRATADRLATAHLVGRRRYQLVVAALEGPVTVEVAPKGELACVGAYDDLGDRESFDGTGEQIEIPTGGILIVDIGEAARILAPTTSAAGRAAPVVLHVTVEGG